MTWVSIKTNYLRNSNWFDAIIFGPNWVKFQKKHLLMVFDYFLSLFFFGWIGTYTYLFSVQKLNKYQLRNLSIYFGTPEEVKVVGLKDNGPHLTQWSVEVIRQVSFPPIINSQHLADSISAQMSLRLFNDSFWKCLTFTFFNNFHIYFNYKGPFANYVDKIWLLLTTYSYNSKY